MDRNGRVFKLLALVMLLATLAACSSPLGQGGGREDTQALTSAQIRGTVEAEHRATAEASDDAIGPGATPTEASGGQLGEADIRATVEAEVRATYEARAALPTPPPALETPVPTGGPDTPEPTAAAAPTDVVEPAETPDTGSAVSYSTPEPTIAPPPTSAPPTQVPPARTAASAPPATLTEAPTPALTATTAADTRLLEDEWYVDTDRDGAPDFVERQVGYDPKKLDCVSKRCGKGLKGTDFLKKGRNTLLMLDSSGSMAGDAGGETKLEAAKSALDRYVRMVNGFMKLGFLVYGHKGDNTEAGKAESCRGIDLLDPIGQVRPQTFPSTLAKFQPTGWTPIERALVAAGNAFKGKEGANNRIVLVSDGIETCGGNPVETARRLHDQGIAVEIDVIGFDIAKGSPDERQLREIARVTGGSYYDAKSEAELTEYFVQQGKALGQTLDALICNANNAFNGSYCEYTFSLKCTTRISEIADKVYASNFEKWQAYMKVNDRIRNLSQERIKALDNYLKEADALRKQHEKLREQIDRVLNER